MSLSVIDLGELKLASSTAALELTISSAATLDASAGANHARDRSISIDCLMAAPADKPLIRASRLLTFTITLVIYEDVTDGTEAQVLLRKFVHCLKSAQLWNQLDLIPSNVEVISDHASSTHRIVLGLTCTDGGADGSRVPPHKLPMGASSLDMRVPDGIQTAEMSAVELEFLLIGSSTGKVRFQNAQSSMRSDHDQTQSRTTAFEKHDCVSLNISTDYAQADEMEYEASRDASNLHQASFFMDDQGVWSDLMSLDDGSPPSQKAPESSQQASAQPECDRSSLITSSLNMLFAAVRFVITKNPIKLAKGIRIVSSESFRHLSEIAPAIWSPGCCRGLASRAVFLPTIDHALGAVGGARSLSGALKAKMTEVQRRSGRGDHTGTPATSPSTACQLWRTMQHKLLCCEDANRLRPLEEAALGPSVDDEGLMGAEWDFMNEDCPERYFGATYPRPDSMFDPLEEDDMLAAWEDAPSPQCQPEEPSPGVIDDIFRDRNCNKIHDDLGPPVWTGLGCDKLYWHVPHNEPSADMDLMSWETEHDAYEDLLDF